MNPLITLREEKRTLLCIWYGEDLYEEDAPREKLVAIVKHITKELEEERSHTLDLVSEEVGKMKKPEFIIPDCENCGEEGWGKAWYGKGSPNDPYGYGDAYYPTGEVVFCKECSPKFEIGKSWNQEEIWKRTSENPVHEQIRINNIRIIANKGRNETVESLLSRIQELKGNK